MTFYRSRSYLVPRSILVINCLDLGSLTLPLRSVSSPVTVQSVGGEVLRVKRPRRMSSSEDVESDKVNDLAYYTTSSSPNHSGAPAAIVLPAQTAAGWTQADLEHAAIG